MVQWCCGLYVCPFQVVCLVFICDGTIFPLIRTRIWRWRCRWWNRSSNWIFQVSGPQGISCGLLHIPTRNGGKPVHSYDIVRCFFFSLGPGFRWFSSFFLIGWYFWCLSVGHRHCRICRPWGPRFANTSLVCILMGGLIALGVRQFRSRVLTCVVLRKCATSFCSSVADRLRTCSQQVRFLRFPRKNVEGSLLKKPRVGCSVVLRGKLQYRFYTSMALREWM